jgi:hypothetical protein
VHTLDFKFALQRALVHPQPPGRPYEICNRFLRLSSSSRAARNWLCFVPFSKAFADSKRLLGFVFEIFCARSADSDWACRGARPCGPMTSSPCWTALWRARDSQPIASRPFVACPSEVGFVLSHFQALLLIPKDLLASFLKFLRTSRRGPLSGLWGRKALRPYDIFTELVAVPPTQDTPTSPLAQAIII